MSSPNFVDHVKIFVRSGKGGAGAIHFRRARFIPKGGPDGGNGGHGGHIIIQGNSQLSTLLHLKYRKHIFGENGENGSGKNSSGADGKDTIIQIPLGTVVKDTETGIVQAQITEDGQQYILAQGGQGGLGNTNFKSATRQAPRFAQPGKEAQEAFIVLELKLMADIGIIGPPNAGKSTLLSVISAAKPQIANYPFTTLVPQLGVVAYMEHSFVAADIPGLIKGAAQGKGLGIRFLRHAERNKVLLFVIPADDPNIIATYHMLRGELEAYNANFLDKNHLLAISKIDLLERATLEALKQSLPNEAVCVGISSITEKGINQLKQELWALLYATP